ncbi:MAG: hypothetical protein KTR19_10920 [Hyphomicrobiales bacterium]|nr:hypothetical protein [Hyphomicrobiales bacterium]
MQVKRIVANFQGTNPSAIKAFYEDIFGLNVLMDLNWIVTFGSPADTRLQLSVMHLFIRDPFGKLVNVTCHRLKTQSLH